MKHLFAAFLMLMPAAFCPARAFALERKEQLPAEMLLKICGASLTNKALDFYAFSRRVVFNGGYDMHEISVGDIVHLYNDYLNNYDKIIEMFYFFHQRIDSGMSMLLFAMCFPNPPEYPEMASCRLEKSKRKKNPCPWGVSARTARQAPRHAHENAKGDRYGLPVQRQP